jgi:hypothetical protein
MKILQSRPTHQLYKYYMTTRTGHCRSFDLLIQVEYSIKSQWIVSFQLLGGGDVSETWHIILVHGTFARNAAWMRPDSELRKHIEAHLPGRVVFHRFRWSGLPSHFERDRAARDLRARLLKCVHNSEAAHHHCVISHSHGGNVVCYALRDAPELVDRIDRIIKLSTPFLWVRSSNLSLFGLLSAYGVFLVAAIAVFLLAIGWALGPSTPGEFLDLLRDVSAHQWSYKYWIAVLIMGLTFAFFGGAAYVLMRWNAWLDATLAMPELVGERLLIVRSFADEATALLVAAQFFEIVVSMFWGRSGAFDRALLSSGAWLFERCGQFFFQTRAGVWVSSWSIAGVCVLIPVSTYFSWMQPDAYAAFFYGPYTPTAKSIWIGVALFGAPIVLPAALLLAAFLFILVCGVTIGLVVLTANCCLALIMLVVVPELGPMAFFMAISAEPVPGAGIFRVLQIKPQHKIGMVETRFHSTTYADLAALDAIAAFIAQPQDDAGRLRKPPSPVVGPGACATVLAT